MNFTQPRSQGSLVGENPGNEVEFYYVIFFRNRNEYHDNDVTTVLALLSNFSPYLHFPKKHNLRYH